MGLTTTLKKYQVIVVSVFFLFLSLHLVSGSRTGAGGEKVLDRLVMPIAAVIQKPLSSVFQGLKHFWRGYVYLIDIKKDNDLLKKKIALLNEQNNLLRERSLESDRLKSYLQNAEASPYSFTVARLIGIDSTGLYETVIIDKGTNDGLAKDMAVVTHEGIVGRILKVFPKTSQVLLILDNNSSIDVIVQRNRVRGIAKGTVDGNLTLQFVSKKDDIRTGDKIISSGLGGIFPKGLIVGEITGVKDRKGGFFKDVALKPSVDFLKLEEVFIIQDSG
ncbi:MAG: rod shape-determining protein MreC [Thermodesulfobacteriota bacterium]